MTRHFLLNLPVNLPSLAMRQSVLFVKRSKVADELAFC